MSIWQTQGEKHPSCTGNYRTDLIATSSSDPSYLSVNSSREGLVDTCTWAKSQCSFNFHGASGVREITADISMGDCTGTWTAPFWVSPDPWVGGGASGEIDLVELCGGKVWQNYSGGTSWGGTQAPWESLEQSGFTKQRFHIKYSPDDNGSITTWACPLDAAGREESNCAGGGNYTNYSRTYGESEDAIYHLTSDIWNGTGHQDCQNPNPNSVCNYEISNVQFHIADGVSSDDVFQGPASDICQTLIVGASPSPCQSYESNVNKVVTLTHGDLPDASSHQETSGACCAQCASSSQCDAAVYWNEAPKGVNNCFLKGSTEPVMGKYLPLSVQTGFTTYCAKQKCL